MLTIVPVLEGIGEIEAAPILLRKILYEYFGLSDVIVGSPISGRGRGQLTREGGIERYVELASRSPSCDATIVILDADADCAMELARSLAERVRIRRFLLPTAVVAASCSYEAWFLASLETLCGKRLGGRPGLPNGLTFTGDVESLTYPKRWLSDQFPSGRTYKETQDMAPLTYYLDLSVALPRSRSMRRLVHAVEELVAAAGDLRDNVTP